MNERSATLRYPTPVVGGKAPAESLWVKNDGVPTESSPSYGGNKIRKLEQILPLALDRRATRVVTAGAAGSHHVLATTLAASRAGLRTAAYLWPQLHSPHAEGTLRAALANGLEPRPVSSAGGALLRLMGRHGQNDFVIAVGGAGLRGTLAYADAVRELALQLEEGLLPRPERIVVAVGTGTTAAGLLAGMVHHGVDAQLVGVLVAPNPVAWPMVAGTAARALVALGSGSRVRSLARRLIIDAGRVGGGYGHATPEGEWALRSAAKVGLELDATYTAKAFGRALAEAGAPQFSTQGASGPLERPRCTLYWHTLSAAPLGPLLAGGAAASLPRDLSTLFLRPG